MFRSYKYELRPTEEQKEQFAQIFGNVRWVYNWALGVKTTEYQQTGASPSCFELMSRLTVLKREQGKEWLSLAPIHAMQKAISRLDAAFTAFFAKRADYPTFKSRRDRQSFQVPDKHGITVDFEGWRIKLPKLKWVSLNRDRTFAGEVRQATVSRTATGRHFVSILVEDGLAVPDKKQISEANSVGIDVGVKSFAVTSDGEVIPNPRHLEKSLKHLRRAQRALARAAKGGRNREKKRILVAKAHEKVAFQRNDFLHKLSTSIAKRWVGVCVEDLNILGMLKNGNLARHIGQAGWGAFKAMLKHKLERLGGTLVEIGRFEPSSKTCSSCGRVNKGLTLADRSWQCPECHAVHDRDINAAVNIKLFGLRTGPFSANWPVAASC